MAVSGIGVWELDTETMLGRLDDRACESLGLEQAPQISLDTVCGQIHPLDQERVRGAVSEAIETGADYVAEFRVVRRDGEVRWLSSHGRPAEAGAMIGVFYEVTERRRVAEQDFGATADFLPGFVSVIDQEYRYRFVNKAYESNFGIPRDEIIGQLAREVMGEENWRTVKRWVDRALSGEPCSYDLTLQTQRGERCGAVDGFGEAVVQFRERSGVAIGDVGHEVNLRRVLVEERRCV